jgi:hypothetical protein
LSRRDTWLRILDAVGVLWLAFLGISYLQLMLASLDLPPQTEPLAQVDGQAAALLALMGLAGIIRCLLGRRETGSHAGAPPTGGRPAASAVRQDL